MIEVPKRPSLAEQVVEILRKGLDAGEWSQQLPSERSLSRQLQVSRPTLRAALKLLHREGLVKMKHGRQTQICLSPRGPMTRRNIRGTSRQVGVLSFRCFFSSFNSMFLKQMELQLRMRGYIMEWHVEGHPDDRSTRQRLENLLSRSSHACWLLVACPYQIQRLFKKAGIPALILGTCWPDIDLPSIDVDYRAIGRHAAQTFLRYGHRRIVMLAPESPLAGDLNGEQAFHEVLRLHPQGPEFPSAVIRHNGSVHAITKILNRLFRIRRPPTGIFVSRPLYALTVATYLMSKGIRLPADVSIIARDTDVFFGNLMPSLACYVYDADVFVNRHVRAVIQFAHAGTLRSRSMLIMPEFYTGTTLTIPPADA